MRIIFHHPLPLDINAKSASGIRPLKMLDAFKAIGCEVDLVTGYTSERKHCIEVIKRNIKQGKTYDFVYSESSTMPTILTDTHHLPLHPLVDWFFFRFCKKHSIPIGLFYRDIYWLFDSYGQGLSPLKTMVAKVAYHFDLKVYQKTLSKLYLPSMEMGEYVPVVNSSIFGALPPGHTSPETTFVEYTRTENRALKLFYVGGMSSHYQLHKLFAAVSELPLVELTICTREAEWQAIKDEYPKVTSNIRVIHKSGLDMQAELQATDIAVLFVKPLEYWDFACPVKLYEYLGFTKPILASEGTLAGQFVAENDIGWTIPYENESLKHLLLKVADNPEIIRRKVSKLTSVASQHSWQARAKKVVKDLVK